MPLISRTDKRARDQNVYPATGETFVSFGEVFDASVGFVIDENLSISRALNNEGKSERRKIVREKVDAGEIDRIESLSFDALSERFPDIKSDSQLQEERSLILKQRREYYNNVIRRSDSFSAELLGSLTGYMTDPINLAGMAVTAPYAIAKSATVLGAIARGAAGAAIVNTAIEVLIQPLVMAHKMDIDSPYGMEDAITNIGMAALGGVVLGGTAGGVLGWMKSIKSNFELEKIAARKNPVLKKLMDEENIDLVTAEGIWDDYIEVLNFNPNKVTVIRGYHGFIYSGKDFIDICIRLCLPFHRSAIC